MGVILLDWPKEQLANSTGPARQMNLAKTKAGGKAEICFAACEYTCFYYLIM
ncbi:hypothetical protein [Allofournierella massiliensis]|uniref:hypothetical protein n=1 Tax=Allofournierella massiliensis TaxID=1650663 RepID=UPI003568BAD0